MKLVDLQRFGPRTGICEERDANNKEGPTDYEDCQCCNELLPQRLLEELVILLSHKAGDLIV